MGERKKSISNYNQRTVGKSPASVSVNLQKK